MLVPIGRENMSARRWPVITIGLILLNFGVFLNTHWIKSRLFSHFTTLVHSSTSTRLSSISLTQALRNTELRSAIVQVLKDSELRLQRSATDHFSYFS